jgi:uncharacterized protein (TIGR02284 family)
MKPEESIEQLNSFLRGEISAVETYQQALERIEDPSIKTTLQDCLRSHETRTSTLRSYIQKLGGIPAEGSGAWGAFAKLVEGGATAFGTNAAIAALEEGEDHGLRDYRSGIDKLDSASRQFFETEVFSTQRETHRVMSTLKKTLQN